MLTSIHHRPRIVLPLLAPHTGSSSADDALGAAAGSRAFGTPLSLSKPGSGSRATVCGGGPPLLLQQACMRSLWHAYACAMGTHGSTCAARARARPVMSLAISFSSRSLWPATKMTHTIRGGWPSLEGLLYTGGSMCTRGVPAQAAITLRMPGVATQFTVSRK